ncbi:MAG: SAM-dependent methyltransferase [Alphaproteobacteria bacterium]
MTHPQHGYYVKNQPFGAPTASGGDFVTAPHITSLFGDVVAVWVAKTWEKLGKPVPFSLVEGGAGDGQLMADMLRALKRMAPACFTAIRLVFLEVSPRLRGEQALAVQHFGLEAAWAEHVLEIPQDFPVIFVANELLDALPIQQFCDTVERCVTLTDEKLNFTPPTPVTREYPCDTMTFLQQLLPLLKKGAALFLDYGYIHSNREKNGAENADTLQALHRHTKVDVLSMPGDCDLTAHVPFGLIAELLAEKQGKERVKVEDMAHFLLKHGLALRATQALDTAKTPEERANIEAACARLLHPNAMGSLFKVLEVLG